ncbi:transcription elongation factor GreA [Patescibacteria group bacterium]|nr:transcription elongation factor GreA [Patescibacteria group bacterium]
MSNDAYITKDGLVKIQEELRLLKTEKKREVAERIERAKELGDLSENAEYADAKDEMAFVEGRILELADYINRAVVIVPSSGAMVQVGSTVVLKNGKVEKIYTIVGANEADPLAGRISNETPLAQALLGKNVGDTVEFTVPSGKVQYTIKEVR